MSNTDLAVHKQKPWQFKPGQSGNPAGRPKGARSKLSESFLEDLRDAWDRHGVAALDKCATEHPDTFVKVVAGLMPKDITLNVGVDPRAIAANFRAAVEALGNQVPARRTRVIEHDRNRR